MRYLCGPAPPLGIRRTCCFFSDPLLPLAHHLLLEVSHGLQEVFPCHIRGWEDDAAVQELVDAVQEILPVVGKIRHLVEILGGGGKPGAGKQSEPS